MTSRDRSGAAGSSRMRTTRQPSAMGNRYASTRANPARPQPTRAASVVPITSTRGGALSPASGITSGTASRNRSPVGQSAGVKRKERDYEEEAALATNINVVVRCRGRNDREVKENSAVVVKADKTVGKSIELSMGTNALSNKTYTFDKVFSPAANQAMVFDEVVAPILDQMLHGFNCTIFAYGQTGTGKTYTMSGDMSDSLGLLSDSAGIIPRVLNALFKNLDVDEPKESSVKCSFIELYNEELRDLIALDENTKLKIFDQERKGHTSTVVQGMEEAHIKNADAGIKLLELGSHRRQVAATKCNDLSSRSHTVFTVTVYTKRISESGEDMVCTGKLNLVDLAGSENIQRSGAENKRATEAGLINKSLLTLGRVINALVDKGSHIPYRESKLTRLLQDSLGGRTKTCIIATVSPAKSNLEETMSTLDYAFRAKNIRNKPQVNQLMSKHTLLREFTAEIQQLKSELIMTRQRNGVYLASDVYEEMTIESESRRILSEEQKAKLDIMEASLRSKIQELLDLTTDFSNLKKDNEGTRKALSETSDVLEQTEIVLADTKQTLAEESLLRKAHQSTEQELAHRGEELISTLGKTVRDVDGLHEKIRRKSSLQAVNRSNWQSSQSEVASVTKLVEARIADFQQSQQQLIDHLSHRVLSFVAEELEGFEQQKHDISAAASKLESVRSEITGESLAAHVEMNEVLEEIKVLREDVKNKVGDGLKGLSAAAGRISAGVIEELGQFHQQLHKSYKGMGDDFKSLFEDLNKQLVAQKAEAHRLRDELASATATAQRRNDGLSTKLEQSFEDEKVQAANDRTNLLAQIDELIKKDGEAREARLQTKMDVAKAEMQSAHNATAGDFQSCQGWLDMWIDKEASVQSTMVAARDSLRTKMKSDWVSVNDTHVSISETTNAVHQETVRIVDEQMAAMDVQMASLDDFVTKARSQNENHHKAHADALQRLTSSASATYDATTSTLDSRITATYGFDEDVTAKTAALQSALPMLDQSFREPLSQLRDTILATPITEYSATGETPAKRHYIYPKALPRTATREQVLARGEPLTIEMPALEPSPASAPQSPCKEQVYTDADSIASSNATSTKSQQARVTLSPMSPRKLKRARDEDNHTMPVHLLSLREIDTNIVAAAPLLTKNQNENSNGRAKGNGGVGTLAGKKRKVDYDSNTAPVVVDINLSKSALREMGPPPLKRLATDGSVARNGHARSTSGNAAGAGARVRTEGRENLPLGGSVGQGSGNGSGHGSRRQLRSSVRGQ